MQPYFFPYLGYFELIARTDRWIVFDTVKYKPKSWMNRNRVLSPGGGWQYIGVPVHRHVADGALRDVTMIDADDALQRITGRLMHYRKARAPFFSAVMGLVAGTFEQLPDRRLVTLNVRSLERVCRYLGLAFEPVLFSSMALSLPPIDEPGGWALEISSALGATEYVNPPGGSSLFDPAAFSRRGIQLTFTDLIDYRYDCRPYAFVDHLSVIDVLMWNAPETVAEFLLQRHAPT